MKGIERFRQAIRNQRDAGEGEFCLIYHDAEKIAAKILFGFDWPDYDFDDVAYRLARLIYPKVCEDIESDERGDNDAV